MYYIILSTIRSFFLQRRYYRLAGASIYIQFLWRIRQSSCNSAKFNQVVTLRGFSTDFGRANSSRTEISMLFNLQTRGYAIGPAEHKIHTQTVQKFRTSPASTSTLFPLPVLEIGIRWSCRAKTLRPFIEEVFSIHP